MATGVKRATKVNLFFFHIAAFPGNGRDPVLNKVPSGND